MTTEPIALVGRLQIAFVKMERKRRVKDVMTPAKLLTSAERDAKARTADLVSRGINPYSKDHAIETPETVAAAKAHWQELMILARNNPQPSKLESLHPELSDEQFEALDRRWKAREDGNVKTDYAHQIMSDSELMDLGLGHLIRPPSTTVTKMELPPGWRACSFCNAPIEPGDPTATEGKGKTTFKHIEEMRIVNGELETTEKLVVSSAKLIACPECVLQLPTIKFPETEG